MFSGAGLPSGQDRRFVIGHPLLHFILLFPQLVAKRLFSF